MRNYLFTVVSGAGVIEHLLASGYMTVFDEACITLPSTGNVFSQSVGLLSQ